MGSWTKLVFTLRLMKDFPNLKVIYRYLLVVLSLRLFIILECPHLQGGRKMHFLVI